MAVIIRRMPSRIPRLMEHLYLRQATTQGVRMRILEPNTAWKMVDLHKKESPIRSIRTPPPLRNTLLQKTCQMYALFSKHTHTCSCNLNLDFLESPKHERHFTVQN